MSENDDQVARFVEACLLIAETDLPPLVENRNPELREKLRYFAPSALEALVQLDLLIEKTDADSRTDDPDPAAPLPAA